VVKVKDYQVATRILVRIVGSAHPAEISLCFALYRPSSGSLR